MVQEVSGLSALEYERFLQSAKWWRAISVAFVGEIFYVTVESLLV